MFKAHCNTVRVENKVVGEVIGNVFRKKVKASRHMLREPKGWALDAQSLDDAVGLGADSVEIVDTETDTNYSATVELIQARGFRLDRGFGPQICLPLQFWTVHRPGEAEQLAFALT